MEMAGAFESCEIAVPYDAYAAFVCDTDETQTEIDIPRLGVYVSVVGVCGVWKQRRVRSLAHITRYVHAMSLFYGADVSFVLRHTNQTPLNFCFACAVPHVHCGFLTDDAAADKIVHVAFAPDRIEISAHTHFVLRDDTEPHTVLDTIHARVRAVYRCKDGTVCVPNYLDVAWCPL